MRSYPILARRVLVCLAVASALPIGAAVAKKHSEIVAILGGQGPAPYAALLRADGSVETLSGLPATGLTYRVAMNSRGLALIGGTSGADAYAARIDANGKLQPIENLLAPGEIYTVALNDAGRGIVGGGHALSSVPYAALVSPAGQAQALDVPASGLVYGSAIGRAQTAILGGIGPSNSAWAALVSARGNVKPLQDLPATGAIYWVAVNDSRLGFIGGKDGTSTYAAFVSRQGRLRPVSGLPPGTIYIVALSNDGAAIVGGTSNSHPFAALVSRDGEATTVAGLPAGDGIIYTVARNDSGTGLMAGFSDEKPYGALVAPDGTLTPLAGLPTGKGFLDGIALDDDGFGIVGGESDGAPFAALVSPDGALTYLDGLPVLGAVNSISGAKSLLVTPPVEVLPGWLGRTEIEPEVLDTFGNPYTGDQYWTDTDGIAPATAGCHYPFQESIAGVCSNALNAASRIGEYCNPAAGDPGHAEGFPAGALVETNPGANVCHEHADGLGHPDVYDCDAFCKGVGSPSHTGACVVAPCEDDAAIPSAKCVCTPALAGREVSRKPRPRDREEARPSAPGHH
jgi:hypothetical protein